MQATELVKRQRLKFGPKKITKGSYKGCTIVAEVRHDDECGNGHNTFSITGTIRDPKVYRDNGYVAGGCLHEEIAANFPELAPFIKWHLCSTDGPMHYPGNVLYFAGARDCWGKLKGEVKSYRKVIQWNNFPIHYTGRSKFIDWCESVGSKFISDCEVFAIQHENRDGDTYKFGPKYTIGGFDAVEWHDCPFDTELEALQFVEACKGGFSIVNIPDSWGEGKKRELDSARNAAIWPEATDAELMDDENLKQRLIERLPGLMAEFQKAVESLGLKY